MSDEPVDGGAGDDAGEAAGAVDGDEHTARATDADGPPARTADGTPARTADARDVGAAGGTAGDPADGSTGEGRGFWQWRAREVEVPMRVYKTVTVFATLFAIVAVLVGFVLLDHATNRAQLPLADVDAVVALLGLGSIVFGAAVYAYSTRFRAAGMGKPNSDGNQGGE